MPTTIGGNVMNQIQEDDNEDEKSLFTESDFEHVSVSS